MYRRILCTLLLVGIIYLVNHCTWRMTLLVLENSSGKAVYVLTSFANKKADELRVWYFGEDIVNIWLNKIKGYFFAPTPAPSLLEAGPSDIFFIVLLIIGVWDGYLWYFLHMSSVADREAVSAFFRFGSLAIVSGLDAALHYSFPKMDSIMSLVDHIGHFIIYFGFFRIVSIGLFLYYTKPTNAVASMRRSINGLYYTALFELGTDRVHHVAHLHPLYLLLFGITLLALHAGIRWCMHKGFDKLAKILKEFPTIKLDTQEAAIPDSPPQYVGSADSHSVEMPINGEPIPLSPISRYIPNVPQLPAENFDLKANKTHFRHSLFKRIPRVKKSKDNRRT